MDRETLRRLIKTYDLSGFTPQRGNPHLRSIAKIIAARPDDQTCIEDLTEYLLLNGIPVGDRWPGEPLNKSPRTVLPPSFPPDCVKKP